MGDLINVDLKKFKSFRKQLIECKANGNLIDNEYCFECGHKLLICKKYGGQCKSNKCRDDRIAESLKEQEENK